MMVREPERCTCVGWLTRGMGPLEPRAVGGRHPACLCKGLCMSTHMYTMHTLSPAGHLHHPCWPRLPAGHCMPLGERAPHPALCRGRPLHLREVPGWAEAGQCCGIQGSDDVCGRCRRSPIGAPAPPARPLTEPPCPAAREEQGLRHPGCGLWGWHWSLHQLLSPAGAGPLREGLLQCECQALCSLPRLSTAALAWGPRSTAGWWQYSDAVCGKSCPMPKRVQMVGGTGRVGIA